MKIRRTVFAPKFSHYFSYQRKYSKLKYNILFNTQIFNPVFFSTIFILACGGFGFFKPIFWSVGLSWLILLAFLFFRARKLAEGITITRKAPTFCREKSVLEVKYTIRNETGFSLDSLIFQDEFDGVQPGSFKVSSGRRLKAQTQLIVVKKVELNSGMGIKTFKPLELTIQDDLGIFDFRIQFYQSHEVEVFPVLEETPSFINAISPETIEYGFYEVPKRGDSNLFIGIREYRYGDPVKYINWKLSKKTDKLVVNEYEKNTNTFVTLILDLDLEHQTGLGEISTWELAKDLALSIAVNEIKKNNHLQVLAHNLYIPFSSGKSQLETIERHFTYHELSSSTGNQHLKHLHDLPASGQVYYICPKYITLKIREDLNLLLNLKMSGQNVIVFLIDPYQELNKTVGRSKKINILEMDRLAANDLKEISVKFHNIGIPLINLKVSRDIPLQKQLLREAMNLVEVK